MILADIVAVAAIAIFICLGALLGFSRGLKFFTKGIFGIIISAFSCYMLMGFVFDISFVQTLVAKFQESISGSSLGELFAPILSRVIVYVIIFAVVQALRMLVVHLLVGVLQADNIVMKIVNKTLGVVFFLVVLFLLVLFAFHIVTWIGGDTYSTFYSYLEGSVFNLDKILESNPLISIFTF